MKQERVYWVDQAKAVGLLIVMLIHGPIPHALNWYLRSFSMPRFFIIAGLFLKLRSPFLPYIKSKALRLVLPYFFFSFLSYGIWLWFRQYSPVLFGESDPLTPLKWIFYGNGGGNMVHNRPLWFLPCMFTTLAFVWCIARIPKPFIYYVVPLTAVTGYFLLGWVELRPPWSMDLMLTTGSLTLLGYLFRDHLIKQTPLHWGWLLCWSVISVITAFSNDYVRLSSAEVGNFFLFYISAFAGTIVTLDLIKRIPYSLVLSFIGQHTLPIYALHVVVYMFLNEFFRRFLSSEAIPLFVSDSIPIQVIRLAIYLGIGIGIPVLLILLYQKIMDSLRPEKPSPLDNPTENRQPLSIT